MTSSIVANILVILLFLIVLAGGVAGLIELKYESDSDLFFPSGSYAWEYIDMDDLYYTTVGAPTYAYTRNPAYYSVGSGMSSLR